MPNYLERVLRAGLAAERTQAKPAAVAPPGMAGLAVAAVPQYATEFEGEANTQTESNLAPAPRPIVEAQPASSPLPVWPAASRETAIPPPTRASTEQSLLPPASVVQTKREPIRRQPVAERAESGRVEVAQPRVAASQPAPTVTVTQAEGHGEDHALPSDESALPPLPVPQRAQSTLTEVESVEARAHVPPQHRTKFEGEATTLTESNLKPTPPAAATPSTSSPLPVRPAASREATIPPPAATGTQQGLLPAASVVEAKSGPIRRQPVERAESGRVEVAQPKVTASQPTPTVPVSHPEGFGDDGAKPSDTSTLNPLAVSRRAQPTVAELEPTEVRAGLAQPAPSARRAPRRAPESMQSQGRGTELQPRPAAKLQPNRSTFTRPLQPEVRQTQSEVGSRSGEPRLVALEAETAQRVMTAEPAGGASSANLARREVISKPIEPHRGDRVAAVEPMPARQAPPSALPIGSGSGGGERRITIGHIDVHVNNQSPAAARVPASRSLAPFPVDILEGHFLNRFWMKP